MSSVQFKDVSMAYGSTSILEHLSFDVKDGEFLSFLGPSGCGKTTCLRLVSGLEKNTGGEIFIGRRKVSSKVEGLFVPPEKRNLGMVFQSYAVWPHMNVFENVAYPLKIKKLPKSEITKKVETVLAMVELDGYAQRSPHQLSGGQQQRVALARGLVAEPEVLLLDEPLSNLDAKLREKMRRDIRGIQKKLQMTVIFVTHDQVEAMEMSDRIAILNNGKIVQIGTPAELKNNPATPFVQDFLSH